MKNLSAIILLFLTFQSFGQVKKDYLVIYFRDKSGVQYSLEKPSEYLTTRAIERRIKYKIPIDSTDLPVSSKYIDFLLTNDIAQKIYYTSRWMNLAVVEPHPNWKKNISQPWIIDVKADSVISKKKKKYTVESDNFTVQFSEPDTEITNLPYLQQINLDRLHQTGNKGKGIRIAVLDAGFSYMKRHSIFDHLFSQKRIVAIKDFVSFSDNVEYHIHGMQVLAFLAANNPDSYVGSAPDAEYILIRTDDERSSTKIDEYNWLAGAEFADSLGADVISSSLGYATFENDADDYSEKDLNGKTAISSIAAGMAAAKGLAVVVSAGNEGNSYWKYITFPSDNQNVVSVGSVDAEGKKSGFSSIGTPKTPYIKPDLMARGEWVYVPSVSGFLISPGGTSFATPLIAGGIACMLQCFPEKTVQEIVTALKQTSSNSKYPNHQIGWGIPDFYAAYRILKVPEPEFENNELTIHHIVYNHISRIIDINLTSKKNLNLTFPLYDIEGRLLHTQQNQVLKNVIEYIPINVNFTTVPQIVILVVMNESKRLVRKKMLIR